MTGAEGLVLGGKSPLPPVWHRSCCGCFLEPGRGELGSSRQRLSRGNAVIPGKPTGLGSPKGETVVSQERAETERAVVFLFFFF